MECLGMHTCLIYRLDIGSSQPTPSTRPVDGTGLVLRNSRLTGLVPTGNVPRWRVVSGCLLRCRSVMAPGDVRSSPEQTSGARPSWCIFDATRSSSPEAMAGVGPGHPNWSGVWTRTKPDGFEGPKACLERLGGKKLRFPDPFRSDFGSGYRV